jgi:archaellum component FlaF (FlaF/FlaG flagellin family)
MKKNLLTIAAIFVIAITFGETTYAQLGNILNKAKDAIDKKKEKKKEQTQTTTTTTDSTGTQSTSNQQTTQTNNGRNAMDDARIQIYLDDIKKAEKDVENYINGSGEYLIYIYGDTNIVQKAISPKARAEYLKEKGVASIDPEGKINAELDKLAQMIDAPMRKYIPDADSFQFKKPAEISMIKGLLSKENLTIFNVGVWSANWIIAKDSYGLPRNRFKWAYVWAKDNRDDHPYCVRYEVQIVQDYAGGGTYGASFAWKDYNSRAKRYQGCPTATPKTTTKPAIKRGK